MFLSTSIRVTSQFCNILFQGSLEGFVLPTEQDRIGDRVDKDDSYKDFLDADPRICHRHEHDIDKLAAKIWDSGDEKRSHDSQGCSVQFRVTMDTVCRVFGGHDTDDLDLNFASFVSRHHQNSGPEDRHGEKDYEGIQGSSKGDLEFSDVAWIARFQRDFVSPCG